MSNTNNIGSLTKHRKILVDRIIEENYKAVTKVQNLFEDQSDPLIYNAIIGFAVDEYKKTLKSVTNQDVSFSLMTSGFLIADNNDVTSLTETLISKIDKNSWMRLKYLLGISSLFYLMKLDEKITENIIWEKVKNPDSGDTVAIKYLAPSYELVDKLLQAMINYFSVENTKSFFNKFGSIFTIQKLKNGNINIGYKPYGEWGLSDEQQSDLEKANVDFRYISMLIIIHKLNWLNDNMDLGNCDFNLTEHGSKSSMEKLTIHKKFADWFLELSGLNAQ